MALAALVSHIDMQENCIKFVRPGLIVIRKDQYQGGIHMSEVYGYVWLWQPPFSGSSTAPEIHLLTPSVSSYAL